MRFCSVSNSDFQTVSSTMISKYYLQKELGMEQEANGSLNNIKKAIKKLSDKYSENHVILLVDEVGIENDSENDDNISDWSLFNNSIPSIDLLVALNPISLYSRVTFKIKNFIFLNLKHVLEQKFP